MMFLKRILLALLFFSLIAFWIYFSYTQADENTLLVVKSKIQGNRIISKNQFWIYPEKIIPKLIHIERFPLKKLYQGQVVTKLPYHKTLISFDDFKINTQYSFQIVWNSHTASKLYTESSSSIINTKKLNIESFIQETILESMNDKTITSASVLKQKTLKTLRRSYPSVSLFFTSVPDLKHYQLLVQSIQKDFKESKAIQKLVAEKFKIFTNREKTNLQKQEIEKNIAFAIEIAQKIKNTNSNSKVVLEVLKQLNSLPANSKEMTLSQK